jgi:hypothetical protein
MIVWWRTSLLDRVAELRQREGRVFLLLALVIGALTGLDSRPRLSGNRGLPRCRASLGWTAEGSPSLRDLGEARWKPPAARGPCPPSALHALDFVC